MSLCFLSVVSRVNKRAVRTLSVNRRGRASRATRGTRAQGAGGARGGAARGGPAAYIITSRVAHHT